MFAALRSASRLSQPVLRAGQLQKRNLSIHEFQSADLIRQYGLPIPAGKVAYSAAEAQKVAEEIGSEDLVIKAQVLAGGRGKGHFDNGLKGGVKIVNSPREAAMFAEQMIGAKLITKQTGAAGKICNSVYIVERKYLRKEYYLAMTMDRKTQGPMIIGSSEGGMNIEDVAKENPDAIVTMPVDIKVGLTDDMAKDLAVRMGFPENCRADAEKTFKTLYKIFIEKDATQIEINPLAETQDHEVMCMDAKFGFDDNADFRQQEIFNLRDKTQEDPDEVIAAEVGLNFIKLDGSIGCLVNGAGLAMATMDIIKLNGGEPANFLDVGGSANAQAIAQAFGLITKDPKVTAIFVNIFGGIVRCDHIAQGLISVVKDMNLSIPIVVRLQGTKQEEAQKLVQESGMKLFPEDELDAAAQKVCNLSKIVKQAREIDVGVSFELPL
ncbi:hypothetical protein BCR37DRAFT_384552 [Protomyces lactucae-debilis]|uniref:Succinate--CoA ligase [ADP-forming] subunit beta, mitochondrial n=1 Tax=Protomyces lactucae-debilis TaxID=2754530 RepID=A0A1Y2ER98_PROLT|nr:uncharacterized protein BCR37DRAFT_384552 [Protomyces lactucae-debilis]ORY74120.1 hypothetical protein BCR37DRAFT_384552 [Protomyces lactucae-debilis]